MAAVQHRLWDPGRVLPPWILVTPATGPATPKSLEIGRGTFELGGHATVDIDVCPSRAKDNLARLATALRALGARLRVEGDPEGVVFDPPANSLGLTVTNAGEGTVGSR